MTLSIEAVSLHCWRYAVFQLLFVAFAESCALPYWWIERYSLPPSYLYTQPKSTYRYRETFQAYDPHSYVHTKEYSEYTWWENGHSDLPSGVKTSVGKGGVGGRTTVPKTKPDVSKTDQDSSDADLGKADDNPVVADPDVGNVDENPEVERNANENDEIRLDDLKRDGPRKESEPLQEAETVKNGQRKDTGGFLSGWFGESNDDETKPCQVLEADIYSLRSTIEKMFNLPREHSMFQENKERARQDILNKFKDFGLQVWTQNFTVPSIPGLEDGAKEGVNLVGVIPGSRRGQLEDGIVLVGAHYDTVADSNGVDDNGSGLAVMLEVAKTLTQPRCKFNDTLMFVAFDLQENGAMGSNFFVDNYLIPDELKRARAHFQGAFILDGILNFSDDINTQELPFDYAESLPGLQYFVNNTGNRGDFLAMISRNHVDNHLTTKLMEAWQDLGDHHYKLYNLAINMGNSIPSPHAVESHLNFLNSDHATFWYHNSSTHFPETLNAVLLTDTGPFRGQMKNCYHSECDDLTTLSPEKLQFAKKTANALTATLVEMTSATAKGNSLNKVLTTPLLLTLLLTLSWLWSSLQ